MLITRHMVRESVRDRRGVSAEFKFRTWSVSFRAEVGVCDVLCG